jgi:hypothetical protein
MCRKFCEKNDKENKYNLDSKISGRQCDPLKKFLYAPLTISSGKPHVL